MDILVNHIEPRKIDLKNVAKYGYFTWSGEGLYQRVSDENSEGAIVTINVNTRELETHTAFAIVRPVEIVRIVVSELEPVL